MTSLKKATCLASIAIGALWFSIAFTNFCTRDYPGLHADDFFDRQQHIFFRAGYDLFSDFETTRNCAALAEPYRPEHQRTDGQQDDGCAAGYPALALTIVRLFSADVIRGGSAFTSISILLWTLSLLPLLGKASLKSKLTILATAATSQIFIYSAERGNLIFLAAAAVNLFLAWYDSPSQAKRFVSAAALAAATVLKISPVLLGVLYFRERQWREIFCSASAAIALFLVPFLFWGGLEAIPMWLSNASQNSDFYTFCGTWGGAPVFITLYHFNLLPNHDYKLFLFACRMPFLIAALCGGLAAALWIFRRSRCNLLTRQDTQALLILCMLLIPGNMMEYTGLYLMPVFIQWCLSPKQQSDDITAIGFLLLFFQLQLFTAIRFNHFNLLVHNLGFLLIAGTFHFKATKTLLDTITSAGTRKFRRPS